MTKIAFRTIMWFELLESVRGLCAGEEFTSRTVVEPEARALLSRFDERSEHYEVVIDRKLESAFGHEAARSAIRGRAGASSDDPLAVEAARKVVARARERYRGVTTPGTSGPSCRPSSARAGTAPTTRHQCHRCDRAHESRPRAPGRGCARPRTRIGRGYSNLEYDVPPAARPGRTTSPASCAA